MKPRHILALGITLGVAHLAQAGEPAAPNAESLGTIEGILNKCAELDAAHADQYRGQAKMATQEASEKILAEVRSSDAYKRAYGSIADSLAAVAQADALKACKGSLEPGQ